MSRRTSGSKAAILLLSTIIIGLSTHASSGLGKTDSVNPLAHQEMNSSKTTRPARPATASSFSSDDELWVKGRILVKAADDVSDEDMIKELSAHGGKPVDRIHGIDVHIVELPENMNEKAVAALLAHNPKFKFAEVDRIGFPTMTANDTYYGSSWHLPKIQAPTAWDVTLGDGVTIAVVDTGVDLTHPDLVGKLVPGYNFFDNNTNAADVHGHGTGVAGTAAALSNNAVGVTGVAWNARIMPLRISSLTGSAYASAAASAIIWAADHGARVANLSYQNFDDSSTIWSAANYMQNKNGVTVISMGNSGTLNSAANSQPAIYVGATDSADAKTSFSAYGPSIDLAAPGTGIYSTRRGGGYGAWTGTSFSAPIVAGVAALAMSTNPSLTGQQVQKILFNTADDRGAAGWDQYFGWGRINATRAVAAARSTEGITDTQAPTAAISSPTAGTRVSSTVAVNVNATDNHTISKVQLYVGGVLHSTDTTAPYSLSWNTTVHADGSVTLQAKAYDSSGNVGSSSVITVTVDNVPDSSTSALAITSLQATNDATNMTYKMNFTGTVSKFHVFLDTDRNSSTGYATGGIGANYLIEDGSLYKHTSTTGGWGWTYVRSLTMTKTTSNATWTVPRLNLGLPTKVKLVGRIYSSSGSSVTSSIVTQTVTK